MIATIPTRHTAHTLLGTIRWLREDPAERMVRPDSWTAEPMDLDAFMRWFRDRLTEKINRNEPKRGRKDCADWFWNARRLADKANGRFFLREREIPLEFRARLKHRINDED